MRIRQNLMAANSLKQNRKTQGNMAENLEKLASGYRINHAADDAAGFWGSETIGTASTGFGRCLLNVGVTQ